MKEREEQMQVEAGALDRAVEAMAKTMYGPRAWEYADDDIQEPWRSDARECIQAADDHLREHYWAEFRERLEGEETITIELTRESGQALLDGVEFSLGYGVSGDLASEAADAIHAALATTQHKGGSQ